jgi:hypothetical protein
LAGALVMQQKQVQTSVEWSFIDAAAGMIFLIAAL